MKNLLFTLLLALGSSSCTVQKPYVPMKSHSDVMTQNYPTKKAVFVKFGTPTSKETFDNIENWYFKLSEVTNSVSIGIITGEGKITQNPQNPFLPPTERSLISKQLQGINMKTNSTTKETYVKFWFVNDTVIKWETFGVDYAYPLFVVPNYAKEFLYYDSAELQYVYSHEFIQNELSLGNHGLYQYSSLKNEELPSIKDLSAVYKTETKFKRHLQSNGLIVWSCAISSNGKILCLDFNNGEIVERSVNSVNTFAPLVKIKVNEQNFRE